MMQKETRTLGRPDIFVYVCKSKLIVPQLKYSDSEICIHNRNSLNVSYINTNSHPHMKKLFFCFYNLVLY